MKSIRRGAIPISILSILGWLLSANAEPPIANRFEKEIAAFEEADRANPPKAGGILFTGASGIRLWKTLAQDFSGLPVLNRGFGGSQLSDSIQYLDRITLRYRPKTIVIQAGGNDINAGKSPEQVLADFRTYVEKTRAVLPDVKIVLLNIGPSPKRWEQRDRIHEANRLVKDYIANETKLVYVDLWPDSIGADGLPKPELYVADQLHPSAAGYALRTKLIDPQVRVAASTESKTSAIPVNLLTKPFALTDAFKAKLQATLVKHLTSLLDKNGSVTALKGKTADGGTALAFYLTYESTRDERFRHAAVALADEILQDMRAMKHGVLPIKEKDKGGGMTIIGGGPPALGQYAMSVAYILHREGGRGDDLKYVATVLDRFPWNEDGWWASTIDVETGESKLPMTKPTIINKTAAIAMAAGIVSELVRELDPALSASLKRKTDKCIYSQIIPAQEADGFWHYSLSDNDPKEKDVLGYFMLTTKELMTLQQFNAAYREPKLTAALKKAQGFAIQQIAPMTDPNTDEVRTERAAPGTPKHYSAKADNKRSFQLGVVLLGGGHTEEAIKIISAALPHFPIGNAGQDGVHAAEPTAFLISLFDDRN